MSTRDGVREELRLVLHQRVSPRGVHSYFEFFTSAETGVERARSTRRMSFHRSVTEERLFHSGTREANVKFPKHMASVNSAVR